MGHYRSLGLGVCFLLSVGLIGQPSAHAQLTTVVEYTFDDPNSLNPFTLAGDPNGIEIQSGQLKLDGTGFLTIADPLAGALDNYVVEGIFTASSFGDFDFGFARHDPNFDPAPGGDDSVGNNGQGLLIQDFGAGPGQIKALNSFSGATGGFTSGPFSPVLTPNLPTAIAVVQNGGLTQLYVNGALVNEPASNNTIQGTPNLLGIGSHPFDGVAGAFNGQIDRIRLSTFPATNCSNA